MSDSEILDGSGSVDSRKVFGLNWVVLVKMIYLLLINTVLRLGSKIKGNKLLFLLIFRISKILNDFLIKPEAYNEAMNTLIKCLRQ